MTPRNTAHPAGMAVAQAAVLLAMLLTAAAQGPGLGPSAFVPSVTLADTLAGQDAPLRPAFRFRPPQADTAADEGLGPAPAPSFETPAAAPGRQRSGTFNLDPARRLPDFQGPVTVPGLAPEAEQAAAAAAAPPTFQQTVLAASTTGGASRRLAQLPITAAASVAPAPPSANVTAAAADLSADLLLAALAQVSLLSLSAGSFADLPPAPPLPVLAPSPAQSAQLSQPPVPPYNIQPGSVAAQLLNSSIATATTQALAANLDRQSGGILAPALPPNYINYTVSQAAQRTAGLSSFLAVSGWNSTAVQRSAGTSSFLTVTSTLTVSGLTVSKGYVAPAQKQGIDDQRFAALNGLIATNAPSRVARWAGYTNLLQASVHKYNTFWSVFESSPVMPAYSPMACPSGYLLIPGNASEKVAAGYNNYHCYLFAAMFDMESSLALDREFGLESIAVIFSVPLAFTNPGCQGQRQGNGQYTKITCAPTAEHVDDYQDFATFLTYGRGGRWSSRGNAANGRYTHFIVWNEVASSEWFDVSPLVNTSRAITPADARVWVQIYAQLLALTHQSIARNLAGTPSMLYVSLDRIWTTTPLCPGSPQFPDHCPLGGKQFLDILWGIVGTSFDWSIAVHAYGNPSASDWNLTSPYGAYTFLDLHYVVDYQQSQLIKRGTKSFTTAPQAILAASEQHWDANPINNIQAAKNVCFANNIAVGLPNLIWVTHLDFQETWGSYPEGCIQPFSGVFLDAPQSQADPCYQAYAATDNSQWGVNGTNWCCVNAAVGCPPPVQPVATGPRPSNIAYPAARCRGNPVVRASRLCQAMPSDVIAAVNLNSTSPPGLPSQLSVLPQGPFDLGKYYVTLTIATPYATSSCSTFVTVVDAEPITNKPSTCGGGLPFNITQPFLPIGYTVAYAKANGCPVSTKIAMPGNLPRCAPATAYYDQQLLGYSCYPGSVTIPTVNQVIVWQTWRFNYTASFLVNITALSSLQFLTATVNRLNVTCNIAIV